MYVQKNFDGKQLKIENLKLSKKFPGFPTGKDKLAVEERRKKFAILPSRHE